jgi:cellulose synthase/poly-beta-1,6-N-acetylglucosamine synthase-like glycosyltransferase
MLASLLIVTLAVLKLGLCLLLLAASLHLLRLGLWSLRQPAPLPLPPPLADATGLPRITVQLPMYNEQAVAARAIAAACALDWPRLSIDVLDDSTDATRTLIDRLVAEGRGRGHDLRVLRRSDRRGYKAGNLAHGLSQLAPDCEFVALFDADFVPPPDFLRRLMPTLLSDDRVGFVQGRWAYLNERQNLLTRLQALILDGLMLVEQVYLDAHALPLQWNGTGGIFRTRALREAGGWLGESGAASVLTEDLDVSYRALLAGYRGRQLAAVAVPSELPATMAAFRVQQQRWVGGGAQVLRSLLGRLSREGLGLRRLVSLLSHLARHARQPYLALSLLWLPIVYLILPRSIAETGGTTGPLPLWLAQAARWLLASGGLAACLGLFVLSVATYYSAARRQAGRSPIEAALLSPLLIPLSMGLSLPLSSALLSALVQPPAAGEFKRTPKVGAADVASDPRTAAAGSVAAQPPRSAQAAHIAWAPLCESALGLAYLALSAWALLRAQLDTGLTLLFCVAAGLLWVGLGSLRSPRS